MKTKFKTGDTVRLGDIQTKYFFVRYEQGLKYDLEDPAESDRFDCVISPFSQRTTLFKGCWMPNNYYASSEFLAPWGRTVLTEDCDVPQG